MEAPRQKRKKLLSDPGREVTGPLFRSAYATGTSQIISQNKKKSDIISNPPSCKRRRIVLYQRRPFRAEHQIHPKCLDKVMIM